MHRTRDRGQATVELALGLPVVCLVLLGIVQLAVVVRDHLAVQLAAREAARAAAVAASPATGAAAGQAAVRLTPVDVRIAVADDTVSATAVYVERTDVPLIGLLLPDVRVTATATMQLEPP